jgi:ankyrin repeat protein
MEAVGYLLEQLKTSILSVDEVKFSVLMEDETLKANMSLSHGPDREFPLYWAAQSGSFHILVSVLNAGGNVRQRTAKGWNAVHIAASTNKLDVVEELIARGADVNAITQDDRGDTALHLASRQGHSEVVWRLLMSGANSDIWNWDRDKAEWIAERKRHHRVEMRKDDYAMLKGLVKDDSQKEDNNNKTKDGSNRLTDEQYRTLRNIQPADESDSD